jgi:predicted metal-dependent HD superfamily phosphohydrolase
MSVLVLLTAVTGQSQTKTTKEPATVQEAFQSIITRYTHDTALAGTLWTEVDTSYSGKNRHYHTLAHLDNFYTQLRKCRQEVADWETLVVAMVYHDVVYNSTDHRDEERSADLAVQRLQEIHFPAAQVEKCRLLILATKSHALSTDKDTNLFNDADMSILGLSLPVYQAYVTNVGLEYAQYPNFKAGRKKVLGYFLEMKQIFKTDFFHGLYEAQARQNIAWEISTLP